MDAVVYLGSMFSRDERYEMDAETRIAVGNSVLAALMRRRNVSISLTFGPTEKVYDGKVSGKRHREGPRLTFENTVSKYMQKT